MRGQRSRDFVVGQRMNETMYLSRIGREGRRKPVKGEDRWNDGQEGLVPPENGSSGGI